MPANLPQRTKMPLTVVEGSSENNHNNNNNNNDDQFDDGLFGASHNNNNNNEVANNQSMTSGSVPVNRGTSFRELPAEASLITSRRGNISFFDNSEKYNASAATAENIADTTAGGSSTSILPPFARTTQPQRPIMSAGAALNNTTNDNNNNIQSSSGPLSHSFSAMPSSNKRDHKYLVLTKGRRTYIQKVDVSATAEPISSANNYNDADNSNNQQKPSAATTADTNNNNAESLVENNYSNNNLNNINANNSTSKPNSQTNFHQISTGAESFTSIDPSRGEVLEITHSADEPIPNLSFFSMGDGGQFLPRPETIVPRRKQNYYVEETTSTESDEDDDNNNNNNGNDEADSADESFGGYGAIQSSSKASAKSGGGGGGGGDSSVNNTSFRSNGSSKKNLSTYENLREIFSGSKNVPRMFIYNLLDGACFGLWQSSIMPAFMYMVGDNSNSFVGYNAAVQGSCQMFSALAAAYVADKKIWPKHYLLRLASMFGSIAIAVTVLAVYTESTAYFWPSSALWGMYIGIANPSSESIFADSVPGGQRIAVYTYKWILQLLSYLIGYITTVIMFEKFGDSWQFSEMRPVLYAGLFAHISSMISLWFMHTDYTLDIHKSDTDQSKKIIKSSTSSSEQKEATNLLLGKKSPSTMSSPSNSASRIHTINNRASDMIDTKKEAALKSATIHTNNLKACSSCGQLKMRGKITSFKIDSKRERMTAASGTNNNNNKKSSGSQGTPVNNNSTTVLDELNNNSNTNNNTNNDVEKCLDTCDCVLTEKDQEIIEELEDDARREKTGDPLLVEICPAFCCCSSPDENDEQEQANNDNNNNNNTAYGDETTNLLAGGKENITVTKPTNLASVCSKMTLVPILVVSGDILQAVGGGVTVRFFPLFFKNALDVTPVQLSVVFIILCIFAALLSHFLKKFSSRFRRTSLIVVNRILGSGFMFLLQFAEGKIGSKYPMLSYFVLRSALLNSMMGLSRSIIMDFCRKRHRTFFSAMESVSTLSFSGSAAIGGFLADKYGYRSTFGVTGGFYVVAALLVAPAGIWVDKDLDKKLEEAKKDKEKKKE